MKNMEEGFHHQEIRQTYKQLLYSNPKETIVIESNLELKEAQPEELNWRLAPRTDVAMFTKQLKKVTHCFQFFVQLRTLNHKYTNLT